MNISGHSIKSNNTLISDIASDVYDDIRHNIIASEPVIDDILRQLFTQQGKAIRPLFMALVGNLVGGSWETLRKAAMVVEAVHIASLIHDDVIDDSEMRRGEATLNVLFSEKTSVLFGDYIFIKALSAAQTMENKKATNIIYRAVERMLEGEIRETLTDTFIDEETYLRIIADKTASLFAASGDLAVLLSGYDGIERKWARELGESIGMAYQIIDDTLDFTGDTAVMGKPRFVDVMSGRMTLPLIYSSRHLSPGEKQNAITGENESLEKIASLVRSNGGIEYASNKAREYLENAKVILKYFETDTDRSAFDDLFKMLMIREH